VRNETKENTDIRFQMGYVFLQGDGRIKISFLVDDRTFGKASATMN